MLKSLFPEKQNLQSRSLYETHDHGHDLIRLEDISVSYRNHIALEKINCCFKQGSLTAIIGPNGGGKSTLLKAILGMVPLSSGKISLNATLDKRIAYLPQQADMDRSFPLTVQDVVASGHCQQEGFFKRFDKNLQEKVEAALEEVGMLECMNRALDELSGGQFQRVLFARLILQNADCILLDEPFTAIDTYTINDLIKVILKWHTEGRTLLIVNHDLDLVQDHFPTSMMIARRILDWGDTKEVVTLDNLRRAKHISRHLENRDVDPGDEIFEVKSR
jgi:zinc/manganese transport system ATP-binding protein